ncbi:MAG: SDR family NAD(P)-dependent oxidoreductase [Lachnospiraceae bacterium]|nr:SDR family NAD(P)-dependent oxidoreductase [Lachnospiraceae bacterium]
MNRVWMITGAGRGLGRAFAEEAVKNGDMVIATVRKINAADPLMKNESVLPVIMDVTKKEEVAAAIAAGIKKFGRIDVLINNAGFGMSGAFEEVSDEELRTLMETNFFGVTNVTRAVLPVMRNQGSGMILTVSSQAGAMGFLGSSAYCSSKYAVVGLSEALSMELAPFGIQVASILPGSFRTDFRDNSSMKHAKTSLAAYEGSAVHAARDFLVANNHKQEGDPEKAAAFLYSIIESGKLPKRILIGKKCCEDVKAYLEERISEIESYLDESSQTDFGVEQ